MFRKLILVLTLAIGVKVCHAQVKYKMLVGDKYNLGQFRLNIIPITYDSTVSDEKMLKCVDSLPGGLFSAKTYHVLYKDDSTRLAIQINEGVYLFHKRFTIIEYWKNGITKRITYYNKHFKRYWAFAFYSDASPMDKGKYNGGKKKGRWIYFNTDGKKVKMEKYAPDGTLKKSRDYNPPEKTLTTIFNPKHPHGLPYTIQ